MYNLMQEKKKAPLILSRVLLISLVNEMAILFQLREQLDSKLHLSHLLHRLPSPIGFLCCAHLRSSSPYFQHCARIDTAQPYTKPLIPTGTSALLEHSSAMSFNCLPSEIPFCINRAQYSANV